MLITEALVGEHAVLYTLFDHIEATLPIATLDELQAQGRMLAAALVSHARLEDDVLFAALEPHLGRAAGPLTAMRSEHSAIEEALERLPELSGPATARDLLSKLIATARDHFAKEERILFPMAMMTLGPGALAAQGHEWAGRRRVAEALSASALEGTVD